jgi:hypothetical protein
VYYNDHEARRQMCRERADALARDYRLAQPPSGRDAELPERSSSLAKQTLSLLHLLRRHAAAPAFRA